MIASLDFYGDEIGRIVFQHVDFVSGIVISEILKPIEARLVDRRVVGFNASYWAQMQRHFAHL